MKQLVVITCVMLLLLKLKGFNCDNVTLLIPPSKYASTFKESSYCGLSPSEIASLSATGSISSPSTPITVSLVKTILTSPYILSSISPPLVFNFLAGLSSSPSLLQSVDPSKVIPLIETLCASPSLLKAAPSNTLIDFINTITISPKIISTLPPTTLIRILSKLYAETPGVLYGLSPVVRVSLLRALLSPKVLSTLKPTEIIFLINFSVSFDCCALAELPPSDIIELLKTISSSSILLNNIPSSQIINFLYRISKLAPFLFSSIPTNDIDALLTPIKLSIHSQSPTTLVELTTVLSSSPYMMNAIDPSIISSLLVALSPQGVLTTVSPVLLIKLLTEISISNDLIKAIKPEVIIGILYSIKSVSPNIMCDIPPSVRSTYIINLTSAEVTSALSIEMTVKLIDTLSNNPSFLVGLSSSSINQIINLMISIDKILNSIPPKKIIGFIYDITVLSPFLLREMPQDDIRKLLSPLTSTFSLSSLDLCCYEQLLSCISNCPFLLNAISPEQITNILVTLNSVPGNIKKIPSKIFINILIQIFITPNLLPKIPLTLLLNLLIKIDIYSPNVLCSIPPFAITTFMDFLGEDPVTLTSLTPPDIKNVLHILTKIPCFFTQISVKTLSALLDSIAASSAVLYNIPVEIKLNLFYNIYSLLPSIFCSLPPNSLRVILNSFNSFETLSTLSSDQLIELTTVISECPCLLSVLDPITVTNLVNVLSASPSTLSILKPCTIINLITSVLSNDTLLASVPMSSYVRFLKALSTAAPSTLRCIPASAYAIILKPLNSTEGINDLTLADVENLIDTLIEIPDLSIELPQALIANLMAAVSGTFTALPHAKKVMLLVSIHSVSPSLMCTVPGDALTDLLDTFVTSADLSGLPPQFVAGLVAVLSSSPCLMDAASAAAFDALLSLLSASPRTLRQVPRAALARFLAKLSLTPSVLKRAKLPALVSLLSSALSGPAAGVPPVVARALLAGLGDAQAVYGLRPVDVASLIGVVASAPRVLDAIVGDPLDVLLSTAASSGRLLSFASPSLMTSFLAALASSPAALGSVQPNTLVNVLTTLAVGQPAALAAVPPHVATALLSTFASGRALATLPPPAVNGLACLLLAFPDLLAALPLDALAALLRFLSADPVVLGSLPSCTLARLLAALSSLAPLLRALPPGLLATFLSALSAVSPGFLCALPPAVVAALFEAVASDPAALAASTPASVLSLISTLNRSPGLILVLPTSILVAFFTYLSVHPGLLKDTPKRDLLNVVHNVRSPDAIPRVAFVGPPCAYGRFDGDFASFLSLSSPALSASVFDVGKNVAPDSSMSDSGVAEVIPPSKNTMIYTLPEIDPSKNSPNTPSIIEPRVIFPNDAKGAVVYRFDKTQKLPLNEKLMPCKNIPISS